MSNPTTFVFAPGPGAMRHLPLLVLAASTIHRGCGASTKSISSSSRSSSSSNAPPRPPWQQDPPRREDDAEHYSDLPPTVFSPSGRLVSLETAVQRLSDPADPSSSLVVAIQCRQGVAIVASLPQSPYLYDPVAGTEPFEASNRTDLNGTSATTNSSSSTSNFDRDSRHGDQPLVLPFRAAPRTAESAQLDDCVDDQAPTARSRRASTLLAAGNRPPPPPFCVLGANVVGAACGAAPDGHVLRHRLQRMANELREEGGGDVAGAPDSTVTMGARAVARRLADAFHLRTLREAPSGGGGGGSGDGNSYRILASGAILCDRRELWRVDPSGQFYRCRAAVAGRASQRAESVLVEALRARSKRIGHLASKETEALGRSTDSEGNDGRQVRRDLYDLTLQEALAIAAETIRTTLQRSASPATTRAAVRGAESDGAVRVLGLTLTGETSITSSSSTTTTAEWHDDDQLAELARKMRELEA